MIKFKVLIVFILGALWITAQSVTCSRPRPYENCPNYVQDSVLLPLEVSNQANTFTLADTIRISSKISDTIKPFKSKSFIQTLNNLNATFQVYKVVQLNGNNVLQYANVEFNLNTQVGAIQPYQGLGYNLVYNRNQPFNNLQFYLKPGSVGLYVVQAQFGSYGSYIRNENDFCTSILSSFGIISSQQNLQYWNTLGVNSLSFPNYSTSVINKNDKNYFFIKIVP